MENSSPFLQHQNQNQIPSLIPSPNTCTSNNALHHRLPPPLNPQPPSSPVTRSDPNNPYPTTFVQADTFSFKHVVQMLTGSGETRPEPARSPIPPIKTGPKKDHKSASKLYERRNGLKNFNISPLAPNGRPGLLSRYAGSPRPATPEVLSPSILDLPSLVLSPVTPLIPDPFNRVVAVDGCLDMVAEERAIQGKGFYLHPSPANTPRDSEPRLLPLFPVASPTGGGSSAAADS